MPRSRGRVCLVLTRFQEVNRKTDLGAGLVGTIIAEFERKPNAMKFETSNSSDAVFVSIGFLSDVTSDVEATIIDYLASIKEQSNLSWTEDYHCFPSNTRESLFNIELTTSVVPECLSSIQTRAVKAAMRWLMLRRTNAGEAAFKTPDTVDACNISQVRLLV